MMVKMANPANINHVLTLFYGRLPYGANFFTLTKQCNFPEPERQAIFDFLMKEKLIQKWEDDFKYIITEKGIEAITKFDGVEKYLESNKP
jgi:predicted transcriptional regulator